MNEAIDDENEELNMEIDNYWNQFDSKGESIDGAVVIIANKGVNGILQEYAILRRKFGMQYEDWNLERQTLFEKDGRKIDKMDVILGEETRKSIYFDVTSFFGK